MIGICLGDKIERLFVSLFNAKIVQNAGNKYRTVLCMFGNKHNITQNTKMEVHALLSCELHRRMEPQLPHVSNPYIECDQWYGNIVDNIAKPEKYIGH
jgi:hypothetical protein